MSEKKRDHGWQASLSLGVHRLEIGYTPVKIEVRREGKLFGTLFVSDGSLRWRPAKYQKAFKVNWNWVHANVAFPDNRANRPRGE